MHGAESSPRPSPSHQSSSQAAGTKAAPDQPQKLATAGSSNPNEICECCDGCDGCDGCDDCDDCDDCDSCDC